ncbi:aldehyde dehydrogenase [Paraburkholderia phytofirmans]|uniref:aldehyde dehydrogenase n=1 Tax=Paraburkholderia phytofirmans TaxID=261302 RepID=UPI0038BAD715
MDTTLAKISDLRANWLRAHADRAEQLFINNEWRHSVSGATFRCMDPFSLAHWGHIAMAGPVDVDAAVSAARAAFDGGAWPRTAPARRAALLARLGELVESSIDEIARTLVFENGKTFEEMRRMTQSFASDCRFFGAMAETVHGYTVSSNLPGYASYTVREPIGVVAAITPWNTPLGLLGWKLLPALAAGNTVVIKPSEVTPVSTLMLGDLVLEAGFPPGVVNILTGDGTTGAALVAHPGVDKIAFTGSTRTGTAIAKLAAERHARVSLELGGKSPNIVFEDAALEKAVAGVIGGIFGASGQSCNAGSRVLVQRAIYDEFTAALVERTRQLRTGDPLDPQTQFGPLAFRGQYQKVCEYLSIAEAEGARLLLGGKATDSAGLFVEPTILGDVDNSWRIAREEIFGPVASLIPFDDEAEAVRIANDTVFGLAAGLWTENLRRAHRLIPQLRAGVVWVNTYRMGGHAIPFGGYKQSGVGREMGIDALNAYTEVKSVWINHGE